MPTQSATDVFFDQLKDLNSVEDQVTDTLPDLVAWSTDHRLHDCLGRYLFQSDQHRDKVKETFERHGVAIGNDVCKAIAGLIEGGNKHIKKAKDSITRDMLLIAHCRRIAHYEIAAYDFTRAAAETVGFEREAKELEGILDDKKEFADQLARIGRERFDLQLGGGR